MIVPRNRVRAPLRRANLWRALPAAAALALAVSGCKPQPPSGQVLATVDGEEITGRELAAELQSAGIAGTPDQAILNAALAKIVDRKLIAKQGRSLKLEQDPTYLALRQRADEVLLADATVARWNGEETAPTEREVQAFIAANPWRFGERALVRVNQLKTAPTRIGMEVLGPLTSLGAVADALRQRNVAFRTASAVIDTAQLPAAANRQLRAAVSGDPLIERLPDGLLISAVNAIEPAPMPAAQARALARQQLSSQAIQRHIAALRQAAAIQYQGAFGAAAKDGALTGDGATAASTATRPSAELQPEP